MRLPHDPRCKRGPVGLFTLQLGAICNTTLQKELCKLFKNRGVIRVSYFPFEVNKGDFDYPIALF